MARIRSKTNEVIMKQIRQSFLQGRVQFRLASKSWELDNFPKSFSALCKVISHTIEAPQTRVEGAMEVLAHELIIEKRKQCMSWFKQSDELPRDDAELRKYLRLMEREGTAPEIRKANVLALKQWIWQLKQGAVDRDATWHVSIIFWSKEGGAGKSYNVKRLITPIWDYVRSITVKDLGKSFNAGMFANTLVAFFDEFAGAELADNSNLKAILTGKPWDERAIYSDSGIYVKNRMSAIATSNLEPPHGYVDTSGARRFWSIHCEGLQIKHNRDRKLALDSLDVMRIYAAVRTEDPCPEEVGDPDTLRLMADVREANLRTKTVFEQFVQEELRTVEDNQQVHIGEIRSVLNDYTRETKQAPVKGGQPTLRKMLEAQGVRCTSPQNVHWAHGVSLRRRTEQS